MFVNGMLVLVSPFRCRVGTNGDTNKNVGSWRTRLNVHGEILFQNARKSTKNRPFGAAANVWEFGNGAARGIRTPDPLITNEVLYQLSYCGNARRG
jgi:hypothetical protein